MRLRFTPQSAGDAIRKIAITSPAPGDGKTTVAINLAVSLAGEGSRVLLVDADFRSPQVHRYLRIPAQNGLTAVLAGRCGAEESLVYFDDLGIYVLPSGPAVENPADLSCSPQLGGFLQSLEPRFDYMVIDTPPLSNSGDAAAAARFTDGAVLVVRQGRTTFVSAECAKKCLETAGVRVLGCVLNAFDPKKSNRPIE